MAEWLFQVTGKLSCRAFCWGGLPCLVRRKSSISKQASISGIKAALRRRKRQIYSAVADRMRDPHKATVTITLARAATRWWAEQVG
jgi:hypothetical protein